MTIENDIINNSEKQHSFTFHTGNENNDWCIQINCTEGKIKFNRDVFPNSKEDDFAQVFMTILEMNYEVSFKNKEKL